MREILFRGKRIDNEKWIEGGYWLNETPTRQTHHIIDCDGNSHVVGPSTIGQFTGLTDINRTKIFEGDIVKYRHGGEFADTGVYYRNYEIQFCNSYVRCGFRFHNGSINFACKQSTLGAGDCEIIGKIHDNPELLQAAK
ncbi:YopX family protein [Oscillospiraceae bacterium LTW-04]|nr:YopX family protein [Oscillospiraceae bacterium MB24-C1]